MTHSGETDSGATARYLGVKPFWAGPMEKSNPRSGPGKLAIRTINARCAR
jgi:hypothetical protein